MINFFYPHPKKYFFFVPPPQKIFFISFFFWGHLVRGGGGGGEKKIKNFVFLYFIFIACFLYQIYCGPFYGGGKNTHLLNTCLNLGQAAPASIQKQRLNTINYYLNNYIKLPITDNKYIQNKMSSKDINLINNIDSIISRIG